MQSTLSNQADTGRFTSSRLLAIGEPSDDHSEDDLTPADEVACTAAVVAGRLWAFDDAEAAERDRALESRRRACIRYGWDQSDPWHQRQLDAMHVERRVDRLTDDLTDVPYLDARDRTLRDRVLSELQDVKRLARSVADGWNDEYAPFVEAKERVSRLMRIYAAQTARRSRVMRTPVSRTAPRVSLRVRRVCCLQRHSRAPRSRRVASVRPTKTGDPDPDPEPPRPRAPRSSTGGAR